MAISIPYALRSAPDFHYRGSLPHHNEIAVDNESGTNLAYPSADNYSAAFKRRRATAVAHLEDLQKRWAAAQKKP